MLILLHVIIALSGIAYSSTLLFRPRPNGFKVAYGLVAATLASGTYLVVSLHTQILSACVSGLTYLAFVAVCLAIAKYRLAKEHNKQD